MTETIIGRRPVIMGMVALGISALAPSSSRAAKNALPALDPANKKDQALIYRKLAWSMDDRIGFWWLDGTRYGIVDDELTPFWQMHVGSFFKVRDLAEGEYEVTNMSIAFYTDVNTGEFIKKLINPLTGKEVEIVYYPPNPPKPTRIVYNESGRAEKAGDSAPGFADIGATGPAWIEGDQVWVRGDHSLRRPATATSRGMKVNDMPTFFGSVRDVADPAVKMPLAGQMFSDANTWSGFLGMEDRPGVWYSRCLGRKVASYADMPALWRRLMAQEHPDIASDPAKALMG